MKSSSQEPSNLINTNMLDRPPEMHIIRGPDITFNESNQLGSITTTHGNAKDQIDIRTLDISKDSRVIIQAYGTHSDAKHQLQLYPSLGYESGVDYTSYNFQALRTATKGAPVNVELISCYGGYAIYDPKFPTYMGSMTAA